MAKRTIRDVPVLRPNELEDAEAVDNTIINEKERVVVIRFGKHTDLDCIRQDYVLCKIAPQVVNFADIYCCDNQKIPDFNALYELYDTCTIMFFFRNKHIMVDLGTGNNNKINFVIENDQDLIDIIEVVYLAGKKGRGLVNAPKDYSTRPKK